MLTARRLRKLIVYTPTTGVFRWKVSVGPARRGSVAGAVRLRDRGRQIRIGGRLYEAGRLAWLYMTGKWPKHLIIHVNENRSDLRWVNLREITISQKRAFSPVIALTLLDLDGAIKIRFGITADQGSQNPRPPMGNRHQARRSVANKTLRHVP